MKISKAKYILIDYIKTFFRNKLNLWISVSITLVLFFILSFFSFYPDFYLFPKNDDFRIFFYTDEANGGDSEIIESKVSDSEIYVKFRLNKGFSSPYVGLCITPRNENTFDVSLFNTLCMDLTGKNLTNIGVSFYTLNSNTEIQTPSGEFSFHKIMKVIPTKDIYKFRISDFKIPEWLLELDNISTDNHLEPDLKNVLRVNIGNSYTINADEDLELKITSFYFTRNNNFLVVICTCIEILTFVTLFLIQKIKKTQQTNKPAQITISYKPIEIKVEKSQTDEFFDYINNNFENPDLSLEMVSNQTGISQRRITQSIAETFQCNFKTYINQIRINEAKRLLKESNLNIGEIAFMVGFNNQSHFNRVFKNIENINPSEYRINKI